MHNNVAPQVDSRDRDDTPLLTDEAVRDLVALAEIVRKVHARLMAEGYVIQDGRIRKREDRSHNDNCV